MDSIIAASLQLNSEQANQSVKSFREQLKQANNALNETVEKYGLTSKEARIAAQRVAELKDTMGDAATLAEAFNPDRKFQAFGIAVKGVTNGFTALQGVMALVGSESEDLQKTLVRVQGALALSEGVNGLMELKDTFKVVQAAGVQAFQKIKAAIGATGIGLLVVALGSIVAYWDEIKEAVSGVNEEQKRLSGEAQKNSDAAMKRLDALESSENSLKRQGKSEREILNMKIGETDQAIKEQEIKLQTAKQTIKSQIEAEERNRRILRGMLDFVGGGINVILKGVDMIGNILGKNWNLSGKLNDWITKQVFNPEETKLKGQAEIDAIDKTLTDLKNKRDGFHLSIQQIDDDAAKKAKERRDKELAELKKYHNIKARLEAEMKQMDTEPIEAPKVEEPKKDETGIPAFGAMTPEALEKRNALIRELTMADSQIKLQALDTEYRDRLNIIQGNEDAELALKAWYADQKKQIDDGEAANKMKNIQAVSSLIGQAAGLFGKHTAAYKVLATAQAIMDTYTSAVSAYKSMVGIPIVGPGLAAAAAGVAIATGLKNIREINKVQVPGGGGGISVGSLSTAGVQAPLSPTPQVSTTQLDQGQINQIGNATVRAFVVESDVSGNQERIKRLNRQARLGG